MARKHQPESKFVTFLEAFPEVKKWYLNLKRGSTTTAEKAIPNLMRACDKMKTDPNALLEMSPKRIQDKLETLVTEMESEDYAPKYITIMIATVKSFCQNHDIRLDRNIKIKNSTTAVTLENERVPRPSELDQIIAAGNKRTKVATAFIAYPGLRIKTLGNIDGSDGLLLGDLPDLVLSVSPDFQRTPARVVVRANLSKARHQYFTFLNERGCELLIDYLKERISEGEKLSAKSPVITSYHTESPLLTTDALYRILKRAILRAGFTWRPYVLRAYFDTQLLIAENNGLISRDFRVFFMGHSGDVERKYTLVKHTLPDDLLKAMSEGYSRASASLTGGVLDERERQIQQLESTARLLGVDSTEIIATARKNPKKDIKEVEADLRHKIILAQKDPSGKELGEITLYASKQEFSNTIPKQINELKTHQASGVNLSVKSHSMVEASPRRLRINSEELDSYLANGYKPIFNLPSGELVVEFAG